jgi:hypothetical protein
VIQCLEFEFKIFIKRTQRLTSCPKESTQNPIKKPPVYGKRQSLNCEVWGSHNGFDTDSLMWMQVETDDAGSERFFMQFQRDVDSGSTEMLMQVQQRC